MRRKIFQILSLLVVLSLSLTACFAGGEPEGETEADQTMTAFSRTQTAFAEESQAKEQEPVETEAPSETAAAEETEPAEEEAEEEIEIPTEAPVEIAHTLIPGEPGTVIKSFSDTNSALTASGGYVTAGDDFTANLFERPFSETEMFYFSDLDIQKAEIAQDETFYYVTITVDSYNPDGGLQAGYGVEIDEDRDGRGDLLIVVDRPFSTEWDIAGVTVRRDANNDVGGSKVMRPDTGYTGDSYEQVLFSVDVLDDPDMAWARVTDAQHPQVTIAFKKSILTSSTFVWGVWAADSLLELVQLDIQDFYTAEEAGSPNPSMSTFPLKAVSLVDNTCRETFGFTATSPIPGLCYIPQEPTAKPPTGSQPNLGSISYIVWNDTNFNQIMDGVEGLYTGGGYVVALHQGSCSGSILQSSSSNSFTFSGLSAGTYCLTFTAANLGCTTPEQYTIPLSAGQSQSRGFGIEWN